MDFQRLDALVQHWKVYPPAAVLLRYLVQWTGAVKLPNAPGKAGKATAQEGIKETGSSSGEGWLLGLMATQPNGSL